MEYLAATIDRMVRKGGDIAAEIFMTSGTTG